MAPPLRRGDDSTPTCSATSLADAEPLTATASRVDHWLLVEWSGAWGRDAILDSGLPEGLAAAMAAFDRRPRHKAVLVRKGFAFEAGPSLVVQARSVIGAERLASHDVGGEEALLAAVIGAADGTDPGAADPGGENATDAGERFFAVCTNGRHDACCANEGRPLVRALRAGGDAPVWECSHIGGDRFAANVVVLPHGLYFGRVDPEAVVSFLSELDQGLLPLAHYRGRSALPPPAQAVEVAVRAAVGERRIEALTGWGRERLAPDRWSVRIELDGRRYAAEVTAHRDAAARLLTCHAGEPQVPVRFEVGPVDGVTATAD